MIVFTDFTTLVLLEYVNLSSVSEEKSDAQNSQDKLLQMLGDLWMLQS